MPASSSSARIPLSFLRISGRTGSPSQNQGLCNQASSRSSVLLPHKYHLHCVPRYMEDSRPDTGTQILFENNWLAVNRFQQIIYMVKGALLHPCPVTAEMANTWMPSGSNSRFKRSTGSSQSSSPVIVNRIYLVGSNHLRTL